MAMKLTKQDLAVRADYEVESANSLGNLHQRMQAVMALIRKEKDAVSTELWHAVFDLETEVSYTKPAKPPFGKRVTTLE